MHGLGSPDPDLQSVFRIFDSYLDGPADHPVGVAVSGGGDSVALLYALRLWSKRPLHVFCVDHGINPQSARWTDGVAVHARTVGAGFTALKWVGDKPKIGLSAAARTARHALIAEAARQKGVGVVCLAHTEDDVFEAVAMAGEGSNVSPPRMWSPSPAWPEGRGVFLFRPFLGKYRADLRAFLIDKGVNWIDDPANADRNSHRARVRQDARRDEASDDFSSPAQSLEAGGLPDLQLDADTLGALGMIVFDAGVFATLPKPLAKKCLASAAVSAGGGNKLPRSNSVERLVQNLPAGGAQTLCGARIQQVGNRIEFVREAGELVRCELEPLHLTAGRNSTWDGRFDLRSELAGMVHSTAGLRSDLSDADRKVLHSLPPTLRGVLPVFENGNQKKLLLANASLTQSPYKDIFCLSWVMYRFLAACGAYACESDLVRAISDMDANQ